MPKLRDILFGVGVSAALLGACLLVGLGLRYLKPYLKIRTMEEGECTVVQGALMGDIRKVTCQCSQDSKSPCRSHYFCIQIMVNITSIQRDEQLPNITLYDSIETYRLMKNMDLPFQCSYHKCDRQEAKNLAEVTGFMESYGVYSETYPCYFEPSDPTYAIQQVVTLNTAVQVVLWPSLAVIFGVSVVAWYIFCSTPEGPGRRNYASSSLDRVKNINRDGGYERVCTR